VPSHPACADDGVDARAARRVEAAGAQRLEHCPGRAIGRAQPRPRQVAVVPRMVRVVGGDPVRRTYSSVLGTTTRPRASSCGISVRTQWSVVASTS
jgi:hypothetical protein